MKKNNEKSGLFPKNNLIFLTIVLIVALIGAATFALYTDHIKTENDYTLTLDDFRFKLDGSPIDSETNVVVSLDKGDTASFLTELSVRSSERVNESYIHYSMNVTVQSVKKDDVAISDENLLSSFKKGLYAYVRNGEETVFCGTLADLQTVAFMEGDMGCNETTEFFIDVQNVDSNAKIFDDLTVELKIKATPELVASDDVSGLRYYVGSFLAFQTGISSGRVLTLSRDMILTNTNITSLVKDSDGYVLTSIKGIDLNGYTLTVEAPLKLKFNGISEENLVITDGKKNYGTTTLTNLTVSSSIPVLSDCILTVEGTGKTETALLNAIKPLIKIEKYTTEYQLNLKRWLSPYMNALTIMLTDDYGAVEPVSAETPYQYNLTYSGEMSHTVDYSLSAYFSNPTESTIKFSIFFRGSNVADVVSYYLNTIPNEFNTSLYMPANDNFTDSILRWESSEATVIDNDGVLRADFSNLIYWNNNTVKIGLFASQNGAEYYGSKIITLKIPDEKRLDYIVNQPKTVISETGSHNITEFINTGYAYSTSSDNPVALGYTAVSIVSALPAAEGYFNIVDGTSINVLQQPTSSAAVEFDVILSFTFGDNATPLTRSVHCSIAGVYSEEDMRDLQSIVGEYFDYFSSSANSNAGTKNYVRKYLDFGYELTYEVNNVLYPYIDIREVWDKKSVSDYPSTTMFNSTANRDLFVEYNTGSTQSPVWVYGRISDLTFGSISETIFTETVKTNFESIYAATHVKVGDNSYELKKSGENVEISQKLSEILLMHSHADYPIYDTEAQIMITAKKPNGETARIFTDGDSYSDHMTLTLPINGVIKEGIDVKNSLLYDALYDLYDTNNDFLLTQSEISTVTDEKTLIATGKRITDLSGLQYFESIRTLNLSNNGLENLEILSQMNFIENLNLSGNQISDISGLAGMLNLSVLNLSNNQIIDLSALEHLGSLTQLNLRGNSGITDYSILENLTSLTSLTVNTADASNYYVLAANGSSNAAVEIMRKVIKITEYQNVLYLPMTYNGTALSWSCDNTNLISFNGSSYTLTKSVVDTPITLTLSIGSNSLSRSFKLTCLKSSAEQIRIETVTGGEKIGIEEAFPDVVFRAKIYYKIKDYLSTDSVGKYCSAENLELCVTELSGLNGTTSLDGIQYLTGLTTLDLSGAEVYDLTSIPNSAVENLILSGYDFNYDQLIRQSGTTNYLRTLDVSGCYNLSDEDNLAELFRVYMSNDDGTAAVEGTAHPHVDIYLKEGEIWSPFNEYNLRYSDSILSYISMQTLGDYSIYQLDTGANALFAVTENDKYYYKFSYYPIVLNGTEDFTLKYNIVSGTDIKKIKGTEGKDTANNIDQLISYAASDVEKITYSNLSPSAIVLYIQAKFTSDVYVHGEKVTFSKMIQLKFEYNENLFIRIISKNNGVVSYETKPLQEVFPGEDIRYYVLNALVADGKLSDENTGGEFYVLDGVTEEEAEPYLGASESLAGIIIRSGETAVEVYGKYISSSDGNATSLTGLRFLSKITELKIYRDATFGDGRELINVETLRLGYLGLDASVFNPKYLKKIKKIDSYKNAGFFVNLYNKNAKVRIASDIEMKTRVVDGETMISFSVAGDKQLLYFELGGADTVVGYDTFTLGDFYSESELDQERLKALYVMIYAIKNCDYDYSSLMKNDTEEHFEDIFYLAKFYRLKNLALKSFSVSDYLFLLPLMCKSITMVDFQGGNNPNTNIDATYSSLLFDNLDCDNIYIGKYYNNGQSDPIFEKNSNQLLYSEFIENSINYTNIWQDEFYKIDKLVVEHTGKAVLYQNNTLFETVRVQTSGKTYADCQIAYAGDTISLPTDVDDLKIKVGEENAKNVNEISWELYGAGNHNYFNALFVENIGCTGFSSYSLDEFTSSALGITLPNTLTLKLFPFDTYFFFRAFVVCEGAEFTLDYPVLLLHEEESGVNSYTFNSLYTVSNFSLGAYLDSGDYGYTDAVKTFAWICPKDSNGLNLSQTSSTTGIIYRGGIYGSYLSFTDPVLRYAMFNILQTNAQNRGNDTTDGYLKNSSMSAPGAFILTADGRINNAVVAKTSGTDNNYALNMAMVSELHLTANEGNEIQWTITLTNRGTSNLYPTWTSKERKTVGSLTNIVGYMSGGKVSEPSTLYTSTIGQNFDVSEMFSGDANTIGFVDEDGLEIFNGLNRSGGFTVNTNKTDVNKTYSPSTALTRTGGVDGFVPLHTTSIKVFNHSGTNATRAFQIIDDTNTGATKTTLTYYCEFTSETKPSVVSPVLTSGTWTNAVNTTDTIPDNLPDIFIELPLSFLTNHGITQTGLVQTQSGFFLVSAYDLFDSPNLIFTLRSKIVSSTSGGVTTYRSQILGLDTSVDNGDNTVFGSTGVPFNTTNSGQLYISHANLSLITKLIEPHYGITSFNGIEIFSNLKELIIYLNALSDISAIETLHLEKFSYAASGPCNTNKFQIVDWTPLIKGSADSLKEFRYAHDEVDYGPSESERNLYLDDLVFLTEFRNIEKINVGFYTGSVYAELPSAKYIFNTLMDKNVYPHLEEIKLYGTYLRKRGVDEALDLLVMTSNTETESSTIVNSNYLFSQGMLSQLVPVSSMSKGDSIIPLELTDYNSTTKKWNFTLADTLTYYNQEYKIEWQSLSPNVKVRVDAYDGATQIITDGKKIVSGEEVPVSEEELFDEYDYTYTVSVQATNQPITTYILAKVYINGSLYVRSFCLNIYMP